MANTTETEGNPYHRLTLDIPIEVYTKMCHKLVGKKVGKKKLTQRLYITELIKRDLDTN